MKAAIICAVLAIISPVALAAPAPAAPAAPDTTSPYNKPLQSELATYRFVSEVDDAASIFVNPAGLGARTNTSWLFQSTYQYDRLSEIGFAVSFPFIGLGYSYMDNGLFTASTYALGLGGRLGTLGSYGAAFKWHHTDLDADRSPFAVDLGFTLRPYRYLSIGGVWKNANRPRFSGAEAVDPFTGESGRLEDSFVGGLSLRPMTERITLSGQAEIAERRKPGWLVGGSVDLFRGLELIGSYMRDMSWTGADPYEEYTAGIAYAFGSEKTRAVTRQRIEGSADYSMNSVSTEGTSSYRRRSLAQPERFAEIEIGGSYLDEGGGWSLMGGGAKNLHSLLRTLENARNDADVKGVLLTVKPLSRGFIGPVSGNLEEVRSAVLRIREAGKPIVAFLAEDGTAAEMYIASAADRIVIPRIGMIGQIAVSLEVNRMKRTFEKLGVDWDHDTAGAYKSSFHVLFTDTATAVQREEITSLVEESYRLLIAGIAEGRGIPLERMRELADGRIFSPEQAIAEHLADTIGWEEDAKKELGTLAGAKKPDKLQTSSIAGRTYWTERWTPPPSVAVVGAYGSIKSGKSGRDIIMGGRTMGSATVVKQLKAASRQPGLRALVLRVDSGGGSALASDEILAEMRRIKREKKIPVIISMGNVAASGGYWISALGDAIFADPSTVTGSIGVVYAKPVLQRLYEKAGITNEVYKVGEHADATSMSRHMTEDEMEMLDGHMDNIYGLFIDLVAEGRKLSPDRVRELAGGRVYLGTQARELGLIDRTGGLHDAIEYAAAEAGVSDDYRTVYFRAFPGFMETIRGEESAVGVPGTLWRLIRGEASGFDDTESVF